MDETEMDKLQKATSSLAVATQLSTEALMMIQDAERLLRECTDETGKTQLEIHDEIDTFLANGPPDIKPTLSVDVEKPNK